MQAPKEALLTRLVLFLLILAALTVPAATIAGDDAEPRQPKPVVRPPVMVALDVLYRRAG